jgi:DNA-binding beta-propeller fold protein YncE
MQINLSPPLRINMKNTPFFPLTALLGAIALNAISLNAQAAATTYVYTNDGQDNNTVTGFKVAGNGSLSKIGQWDTQGTNTPDCDYFYATSRASASKNGDLLFVSNSECGSSNATISIFKGASRGKLSFVTKLSDADLPSGQTAIASLGNCLILGSSSGNIVSYQLPSLTRVSSIFAGGIINDMKTNKIGKQSYAVATLFNNNQIAISPINASSCVLDLPKQIATSGGAPAGLAFDPDGKKMYVGVASDDTMIEAFNFPSGTRLTRSPYLYLSTGKNSNTVLASQDGKCLFVANQDSSTISAIPLSNGVPGFSSTVYPVGSGSENGSMPIGLANDPDRKQFYVGIAGDNTVTTELIGPGCTLTQASGGAALTGVEPGLGHLYSLTATGN